MAVQFEAGSWVWAPDEEEIFLPAQVVDTFRRGEAGSTKLPDGEVIPISEKDSQELKVVDPQCLESIENMVLLNDLNNASLLHNLRIRFKANNIYTNVGAILVAVNPFQLLPIYTPEWLDKYKQNGSRGQPPHVYGIADDAYRTMMQDGKNHSIVISGESGAGKTETMKLALQYIAEVSGKRQEDMNEDGEVKASLEERILKANPVMEAFGNAKTTRNNNSSRFGKWTEIKFDKGGAIIGGSIVNYLLEKSRVVTTGEFERNYHVFYQLFAGADKTMHEDDDNINIKKKYGLGEKKDYFYINQSDTFEVDGINDERDWDELIEAMGVIEMDADDIHNTLSLVAAVLHLGNLQYEIDTASSEEDKVVISNEDQLSLVARFLEVPAEELKRCLTTRGVGTHSVIYVGYNDEQARGARDALAKTIYGNLFDHLVSVVNATLARGLDESAVNTLIGVLDIFGFESFETNSFEQLCINFCNEKLQYHFNDFIFSLEQEQYRAEGINVDNITFEDNQPTLDLIEKKKDPAGIIPRIDEEIKTPRGTDLTFHSKLVKQFGVRKKEHPSFALPSRKKTNAERCFIVKHYAGPVCYDVDGFLEKSKDTLHADISSVMRDSSGDLLKKMFTPAAAVADSKPTSRRKKKKGSDKKTLGTQFKEQLADLMKRLNTTLPHFVRCFKPNSEKKGDIFTAQMMLEQLNYAGLLEVCRIRQIGYPVRREFAQFVQRYRCLAPSGGGSVDALLAALVGAGITTQTDCVKGRSKVFMRNSQAQELEARREDALSVVATSIEKTVRGFLARVHYRQWKEILIKLDAATSAKNVENLEHYLRQGSSELPNHGVHLPIVIAAKKLNERLKEEYRAKALLEDAILARELNALLSAIKVATDMGDFLTGGEVLEKATSLLDRIREEKKCKEDLAAALERRQKAELEALCERAEQLELLELAEYNQAVAVIARIEQEEEANGLLQAAIDSEDINDISARLDSMMAMGLDDAERFPQFQATISSAKEMRGKLKAVLDAKKALASAIDERSIGALKAAIAQARTVSPAPDTAEAAALVAQIEKEEAATAALRALMNDAGVTLGPLVAALAAVTALALSNDLVDSAQAKVDRLEAMAKAEAALEAAIAAGAADALSTALAEARDCGLDSPTVARADEALAGLGAQAAMLSKLGAAVHNLEELDAAIAEAEAMGGLEDAIAKARVAREHLVGQQSVLDSCKGAIAEGRYPALKAAMKRATECGLDTNPTRAGEWGEVVAASAKLQEQSEARSAMAKAVAAHNKDSIEEAVEVAKACDAMDSPEGTLALSMLKQIAREEVLTEEIRVALGAKDNDQLKELYAEAEELQLKNDMVTQAGMIVNREKMVADTYANFDKAEEDGDLELMNKAMEVAIGLGLEGEKMDAANAALKGMNAEAEQAAKMMAAAKAIAVKGKSESGIAENDLAPLEAAIAEAMSGGGLTEESKSIVRFNDRLAKFRKQIDLQDEIKATIAEKGDGREGETLAAQYKRIGKVLDAALNLEMEGTDVEALQKIHRSLDREVQAERQARNEASDEDSDEEEEDSDEEEDDEEIERKREEMHETCRQARFEFEKFVRLRRPEDWVKGLWFNKKKAIATQMTHQPTVIAKSMLENSDAKYKKESTRIHKCILGYCGDKTMNFPEMLAKDILDKGVKNRDLVDEIFVQICKQVSNNPKPESIARCWQLMCMAVGTFPPSSEFKNHLFNFLLKFRPTPGLVGGYANYCLRRLEGILNSGASGFIPSVAEIEAYKERPPILATIELVDGSPLTTDLPITPDLSVAKVLEICNHFLELKDSRKRFFGIHVVDLPGGAKDTKAPPPPPRRPGAPAPPPPPPPADWDLPRTPAPLREQDFMGDVYVSRRRQGRKYKFVFKRKIYIKPDDEPSDDDMYKRLDFLQACDEVIVGNISIDDEAVVTDMIAASVFVDMEEVSFCVECVVWSSFFRFVRLVWVRFVSVNCAHSTFYAPLRRCPPLLTSAMIVTTTVTTPKTFALCVMKVPEDAETLIEEGCLMEYIPQPWKMDHTEEEWGDLVLAAMQPLEDAEFEQVQEDYIEKVRDHPLFGTSFFHVKRVPSSDTSQEPRLVKDLPDVMYCAFNSDGMHFLADSLGKKHEIILKFGFADIYRWGGSHTRFSLIIWDAEVQGTFELSLYTSQAPDMAALILDYINAIMEASED
jgi:myosin heavy subunit